MWRWERGAGEKCEEVGEGEEEREGEGEEEGEGEGASLQPVCVYPLLAMRRAVSLMDDDAAWGLKHERE